MRHWIAILCAIAAAGAGGKVLPTTEFTNADFPLDPGRDFQCEVCQHLGRLLAAQLGSTAQRADRKRGDLELDMEEFLAPRVACHDEKWRYFEERSDQSSLKELLAACEAIVTTDEDELGEALSPIIARISADSSRAVDEAKLSAEIAAGWCRKSLFCETDEDLWDNSGDHPEAREKKHDRNKKMSEEFLAKMRSDSEVRFLPSGLGLREIAVGHGAKPTTSVMVHYNATFINGVVLDTSLDDDDSSPVEMQLQGLIPGLREALMETRVGGASIAYIPPDLAYGGDEEETGVGPNMAVIFRFELAGDGSSDMPPHKTEL